MWQVTQFFYLHFTVSEIDTGVAVEMYLMDRFYKDYIYLVLGGICWDYGQ